MSSSDLVIIVKVVLLWAVIIGAATVLLQRLLRQTSIVVQICLVVVGTMGVLLAGMMGAFNAMVISVHDIEVMWYILAIASVVALAVALILGIGVARNTKRLIGAAARIGRGETVAPGGIMSSELSALAAQLTSTSEKLEESHRREMAMEEARRELVAWVSHDLRTPLASMRAMAEALEDGLADDVSGYHRRIIAQTEQMAGLVNDLLELSKIHAGTLSLNRRQLDLYDLVSEAIADLAPLASSRGITIHGDGVENTLAAVDGASLGRAIRNVIHNGILYSPPGSTVTLALASGDGWAQIDVEDACGGISPDEQARIFSPGWRKDTGRTTSRFSGAGVGLSMVAGIVQAHRGSVEVANVGAGCRFSLRFPIV